MGPVKISLVQWRERSHGKGNSRRYACGRSQNRRPMTDRDSPRRRTDMREPANKRLITDVSGLAPTVARSPQNNFSRVFGGDCLSHVRGLTTDIRAYRIGEDQSGGSLRCGNSARLTTAPAMQGKDSDL